MPSLSIVIPARNEAQRLPITLQLLDDAKTAGDCPIDTEVIVVDDGSTDDTVHVAHQWGARVICLRNEHGVGLAVRTGMLEGCGDRILLTDADGPVPFGDIRRLAKAIDAGYDIAAGSRILRPEWVKVRQPAHRIFMGRVWAKTVRAILPTSVADTQCGFKLFTRQAARAVFGPCRSVGFAFHVESIAIADRLGLRVDEIPVVWRDQPGSKIRVLGDSTHMLGELISAAWRMRSQSAMHAASP